MGRESGGSSRNTEHSISMYGGCVEKLDGWLHDLGVEISRTHICIFSTSCSVLRRHG